MANEAARAKTHEYSCVMIDLPAGLAREVTTFGRSIPVKHLYEHPAGGKGGREKHPHVTVLYGIHTDKAARVRRLVNDVERFSLTLGKMSLFQQEKFDVLKVEIRSGDLVRLNATLKDRLYHTSTQQEYSPHVTVAYLNKDAGDKYKGDKTLDGKKFDATHLVFSSWSGKKTDIKLKLGAEWSPQEP